MEKKKRVARLKKATKWIKNLGNSETKIKQKIRKKEKVEIKFTGTLDIADNKALK